MAGNSEKSGTRITYHNPGADALGNQRKDGRKYDKRNERNKSEIGRDFRKGSNEIV